MSVEVREPVTPDDRRLDASPDSQAPQQLGDRLAARPRISLPGVVYAESVPLPLAGRDRVVWRVSAVVLCLAACRANAATTEQLHVLTWALRDAQNAADLRSLWVGEPNAPQVLRAWNTRLDDTLQLAMSAGYVSMTNTGRYTLTDDGRVLVRALRNDPEEPLIEEQRFLASLGKLTEKGMWRRLGERANGTIQQGRPGQ